MKSLLYSAYCKQEIGWISFISLTTPRSSRRQAGNPSWASLTVQEHRGQDLLQPSPALSACSHPNSLHVQYHQRFCCSFFRRQSAVYSETPLFPCCSQRTAKPVLNPFQNPACACEALNPLATWLVFAENKVDAHKK